MALRNPEFKEPCPLCSDQKRKRWIFHSGKCPVRPLNLLPFVVPIEFGKITMEELNKWLYTPGYVVEYNPKHNPKKENDE